MQLHQPISGVKDRTGEWFSERYRRDFAFACMVGGWVGGLGVWAYGLKFSTFERPGWVTITFIALMFVGVTGTMIRSRMRLASTIIAALKTGTEIQRLRNEEMMQHIKEMGSDHHDE